MSTELEQYRTSDLAIAPQQTKFTDVQVAALRHLGLQGTDADDESLQFSDADLQVFFHQCQRTGLDPFARQIYMIMRKEFGRPKPTIQTGIDGFRKIGRDAARRHSSKVSKKAPVWFDDDGNEHRVWTRSEPPAAALVNIVVDGEDNEALLNYRDFVQRKSNGDPNSQWRTRPAHMLQKCAEAAAWRIAFPSDFSGIVSTDEPLQVIDSEGNPDGPPQRRQSSTGRGVAGLEQHLAQGATVVDGDVVNEQPASGQTASDITREQYTSVINGLNALFGEVTDGRAEYVTAQVGRPIASMNDLTAADADVLLERIRTHLDERAEDAAREREEQQKQSTNDDANFNA